MKRGRFITRLSGIMFLSFSIVIISVIFFSCQNPVSETPPNAKASITVEDVSCTEAWVGLHTEGVSFAREARAELYRDDTLRSFAVLQSNDTLFYDDGLLPSKTYRYKAKLTFTPAQENEQTEITTAEKEAVTMDTTSHDFTWQTFSFGGGRGGSGLSDVAIINENDIWAVGEIHTSWTDQYDSNGVWVQPYNAVHWNGEEWELKRIMFYIDQDQPWAGKTPSPCTSAFIFNDSKFAITSNVQTAVFNSNNDYEIVAMGFRWEDRFTINAMWGESSSDFYVVGNGGNIAHYNGGSWTKINSGTELDFFDIRGDYNELTGQYKIIGVVNDYESCQLVEIKGNEVVNRIVGTFDVGGGLWESIWFDAPFQYYIAGVKLWKTSYLNDLSFWQVAWQTTEHRMVTRIRGEKKNNLWVSGSFGELMKFNGVRWKSYRDLFQESMGFAGIDVKGNLTVVVNNHDFYQPRIYMISSQ